MNTRRHAINYSFTLLDGGHSIDVTVGRSPDADSPVCELFFVGRGKIGHGLDDLLAELGTKISRILQDRHPETGAAVTLQQRHDEETAA